MLWLYASNEARFEQSVRGVLDQLRVRRRKDPKANVFQLLRGWLCDTSKGPWLVILDNADDARVLLRSPSTITHDNDSAIGASPTEARLDYIPRCQHGRVLVTSRSRDTAQDLVYQKDVIAVEPMEEEQALALLRKKLGTWYTEQDAPRLAQELDYMPLALTQAAAYICQREGRCSIEQYLGKIEESGISGASVLDIHAKDLRRDREANNSIMLTWQISFDHIREARPSAADLLSLMSFFDRHAIPEALLQRRDRRRAEGEEGSSTSDREASERSDGNAGTGAPSERNAEDSVDKAEEYEMDIVVLRNYSLISSTADRAVFEMHRLVQVAMKKWLKAVKQYDKWSSQCIHNLEEIFPTSDFNNWATCQSLFPHAMVALHMEVTDPATVLQQASLLGRSGMYALAAGAYSDAEKMVERSLEVRGNVLGRRHPYTLTSMDNLAMTNSKQGRLMKAEKVQLEVVEEREAVLGAGHPDTLTSMNNLAMTYLRQGRSDEAEKLQVKVVEKKKEMLGGGHPSTLVSLNNLALTYLRGGQWVEAEKVQVEVAEKCKEALGAEHLSTMTSMNNLAMTYLRQGRLDEAEKVQVEVMKKMKESFGDWHPDTLASMNNLAMTYLDQERLEAAEKLQAEVLEKRKEVLGKHHPDTLMGASNLAMTYLGQGRQHEAEKMQVEVVEECKDSLGNRHPSTLTSMNNLALMYSKHGRLHEAELVQVEVLEKSKEALGAGHPDTLRSMNNLAFTLRARGQRQSALHLITLCAEMSQAELGTNHPDTIAAFTYRAQWEEDVNSDDTLHERLEGGGGKEEGEDKKGEGEVEDEGEGAPKVLVEDLYAGRLDSRECSNTWNQPQFLWLL